MAKQTSTEKADTSQLGPQPQGDRPFDPKQPRLEKMIPERSHAERELSRRLMSAHSPEEKSFHVHGVAKPKRPPLGLPSGSVRALLCLIIVVFLVIQTARGARVDVVWNEAMMITLAHYFTTRRFVPLSRELRATLEAAGEIEPDESPLYLPRHSVRVLLIAAFVGLGFYLYDHGRLFDPSSLSLLVSVGAYLLGITARGFLKWWSEHTGITPPGWWSDLKAIATLLIVLTAVGSQLGGITQIQGLDASRLQDISLAVVLYYFGSR
jgi:hypothetical protein